MAVEVELAGPHKRVAVVGQSPAEEPAGGNLAEGPAEGPAEGNFAEGKVAELEVVSAEDIAVELVVVPQPSRRQLLRRLLLLSVQCRNRLACSVVLPFGVCEVKRCA